MKWGTRKNCFNILEGRSAQGYSSRKIRLENVVMRSCRWFAMTLELSSCTEDSVTGSHCFWIIAMCTDQCVGENDCYQISGKVKQRYLTVEMNPWVTVMTHNNSKPWMFWIGWSRGTVTVEMRPWATEKSPTFWVLNFWQGSGNMQ